MSFKLQFVAIASALIASSCADRDGQAVVARRVQSNPKGASSFTVGSSPEEVRAAMGRPDSERKADEALLWCYGFSRVAFRSGRVSGWENYGNNLKTHGAGDTRMTKEEPLTRSIDGGGAIPAGAIVHGAAGKRAGRQGSGPTNPDVQAVQGYTRENGTRVDGYMRTRANSSTRDNFSSNGNVNRYTGERGYR